MIKTEYRYLDSNMNPVSKETADLIEILQKADDGSVVNSKLIVISG